MFKSVLIAYFWLILHKTHLQASNHYTVVKPEEISSNRLINPNTCYYFDFYLSYIRNLAVTTKQIIRIIQNIEST